MKSNNNVQGIRNWKSEGYKNTSDVNIRPHTYDKISSDLLTVMQQNGFAIDLR